MKKPKKKEITFATALVPRLCRLKSCRKLFTPKKYDWQKCCCAAHTKQFWKEVAVAGRKTILEQLQGDDARGR
jgi:hypothetical protein